MNNLEQLSIEATNSCSLVYLIDEDLCLGNSYDIINTNFDTISSAQDNLTTYANIWLGLYTTFSNNSSRWLNALYNITTLSAQWESAYATKEAYKKYWDVPLYIVYPDLIHFTSYWTNQTAYATTLTTWVNANFPSDKYIMNQVIELCINIYTINDFPYSFHREMIELCTPDSGTSAVTLCCTGAGKGSAGLCNQYSEHGDSDGHQQVIECHEICNDCSVTPDTHCESYTCATISPPQGLVLDYNIDFKDRYMCQIISLRFKNDKIRWTLL
jgi:hypothetical protein